jgi:hypothetical protein
MRKGFFRRFAARLSFIILGFVVLSSLLLWAVPNSKAVAVKRKQKASSKPAIEAIRPQGKIVTQRLRSPNQPVEITEVSARGKLTQLNKSIDVDDDWLNGLSLRIKNTSDKIVLSIDLVVTLPDTEAPGQPMLGFPMHYGANPPGAKHPGTGAPLKPNDILDVTISEQMYRNIKPHLESRIPLKNLKQVQIILDLIVFNDDTAWSSGEHLRRDPDNPRRWIPIPIS